VHALLLGQHYAPEVTAGRFRMEAFARELVARGHSVEVICPVPNHPAGVVREGFRGKLTRTLDLDGARVRYVWVRASPKKTTMARLAYYASYAAMASITGVLRRRPDVVFATSPPLSVGAAGALLAKRHRVPWVLDVRDVWPEVAVTLGELSDERIIRAVERLERALYRDAARVVTVTEAFCSDIRARCDEPAKVALIRNGTTREWLAAARGEGERAALGLPEDRFVWTYAGNLGLSHNLGDAIEAAGLLGDGFELQVIGEGPARAELEDRARSLARGSVVFRDLMPPDAVRVHLRSADALLVIQRGDLRKVVSSKLFDCCAIARPVIVVAEGEMIEMVRDAQAGIPVPAGSPKAIAAAVRRLRDDPEDAGRLAERGREYAACHLREDQAAELADMLEALASPHSA